MGEALGFGGMGEGLGFEGMGEGLGSGSLGIDAPKNVPCSLMLLTKSQLLGKTMVRSEAINSYTEELQRAVPRCWLRWPHTPSLTHAGAWEVARAHSLTEHAELVAHGSHELLSQSLSFLHHCRWAPVCSQRSALKTAAEATTNLNHRNDSPWAAAFLWWILSMGFSLLCCSRRLVLAELRLVTRVFFLILWENYVHVHP